jgi:hypothetical protein
MIIAFMANKSAYSESTQNSNGFSYKPLFGAHENVAPYLSLVLRTDLDKQTAQVHSKKALDHY